MAANSARQRLRVLKETCFRRIESQLHAAQNDLNIRISNIVLMGIGEPP
jgi:adenine C2-methylase RlmN of 23S rRNA A2503 and tRNA A37